MIQASMEDIYRWVGEEVLEKKAMRDQIIILQKENKSLKEVAKDKADGNNIGASKTED